MRIVNRKDFLNLPAGTVFMKFPAQPADHHDLGYDGAVSIKWDTCGADFVSQDLMPQFEGWSDSEDWSNVIIDMIDGKQSPPVDYDCAGRDGLFDQDQLFLVWGSDDLVKMIDLLQAAFKKSNGT